MLLAMANALQDKRGDTVENCRADLLRKNFSGSMNDTITWSMTISMKIDAGSPLYSSDAKSGKSDESGSKRPRKPKCFAYGIVTKSPRK